MQEKGVLGPLWKEVVLKAEWVVVELASVGAIRLWCVVESRGKDLKPKHKSSIEVW